MPFNPERAKEAREQKGLTQDKIAEAINLITAGDISRNTVSNWECGKAAPNDANLDALCEVTGKDYNFFYDHKVGGSSTSLAKSGGKSEAA